MQNHLVRRGIRRLFSCLPKPILKINSNWQWLKLYPIVEPSDTLLQNWNHSHWEEYQRWLSNHSLQQFAKWQTLHQQHRHWQNPPKISIVTPVFNTEPAILYDCILSVRMQTYPYWQWILVDDASTRTDTKQLLASGVCGDPRIQVIFSPTSLGISGATNQAIARAAGEHVVFLDHDDRLSLEALGLIANEINKAPNLDIIYSDRDMLSEAGERFLHLFKPDWSPETLLSGNYVFHLMCYRRVLLTQLQGLRSEYDGSQDYDLILRAAELRPKVCHIPKILYHWRQHSTSVALNASAKDYAFDAGLRALNAALQRRGIKGTAREIPDFWRGTYELQLPLPEPENIQIITVNVGDLNDRYAQFIDNELASESKLYVVILSATMQPETADTIDRLVAWLKNFDAVAFVSGKVVNADGTLDYVGMTYNKDTSLMHPYRGFDHTQAGYMGVSQIIRNMSAPHPFCVAFKRSWWDNLSGFDKQLTGPQALLDFALRAHERDGRSLIVPQCIFKQHGHPFEATNINDCLFFKQRWHAYLKNGDPYYNKNLSDHSPDMGIEI